MTLLNYVISNLWRTTSSLLTWHRLLPVVFLETLLTDYINSNSKILNFQWILNSDIRKKILRFGLVWNRKFNFDLLALRDRYFIHNFWNKLKILLVNINSYVTNYWSVGLIFSYSKYVIIYLKTLPHATSSINRFICLPTFRLTGSLFSEILSSRSDFRNVRIKVNVGIIFKCNWKGKLKSDHVRQLLTILLTELSLNLI